MKKFTSLFLALALCMGLAVPVFAAELKSDKYTYTLSNEPMSVCSTNLNMTMMGTSLK